jgi:hypothetical protein
MPASPLTKLGRYELIREIARSNDIVYESWDPQTQRRVAVKALNLPNGASAVTRQDRIVRFEREARAAARLHHPNVVTLFDFGTDDEQPFLVFEYVAGPTLADVLLQKGPLDKGTAVNYACQLLAALSYAHSQGVIHRDIKPSNIFVCNNAHLKISDLGIARIESEASVTTDGQIFGTPAYMAPEQVKGQDFDRRVDIWAAGTVLYQMVSGVQAFTGGSIMEIGSNVLNKEPDLFPIKDGIIRAVIAKALAKDPALRYATAAEMIADLQSPVPVAIPAPVPVPAAVAVQGAVPVPAPGMPTVSVQPIKTVARRRVSAALWASTCVATGCLAAVIVARPWATNSEPPVPESTSQPLPKLETVSVRTMQDVLEEALDHASLRDLTGSQQFRNLPKGAQLDQLDTWCRSAIGKDYLALSLSWRTLLLDDLYDRLNAGTVVARNLHLPSTKDVIVHDPALKPDLFTNQQTQAYTDPQLVQPTVSVGPPPQPDVQPLVSQPNPAPAKPDPQPPTNLASQQRVYPDQRATDFNDAEVLSRLHFQYDHVRVLPGGTREYSGPSGIVRVR